MSANHLHAVAVVDSTSKLVGTLSLSDLKRVKLSILREDPSVETLISRAHGVSTLEHLDRPVTVSPHCTLRDVMEVVLLSRVKVHRCWVVDGDVLIDVVTLTNILQALLWAKSTDGDD